MVTKTLNKLLVAAEDAVLGNNLWPMLQVSCQQLNVPNSFEVLIGQCV